MYEGEVLSCVFIVLVLAVLLILVGCERYGVMYRHREIKFPWWAWIPWGLYVFVEHLEGKSLKELVDIFGLNERQGRMGKDIALSSRGATILSFDDPVAVGAPPSTEESEKAWEKWKKKYANSTVRLDVRDGRQNEIQSIRDTLNDQNT